MNEKQILIDKLLEEMVEKKEVEITEDDINNYPLEEIEKDIDLEFDDDDYFSGEEDIENKEEEEEEEEEEEKKPEELEYNEETDEKIAKVDSIKSVAEYIANVLNKKEE